ncbi:MAG TPA: DUF2357 domain-containing protein [Acidobacteriaceae bacterium]|nr:DUF2357 domain-containing protein [Acidobacteriaceae bacterium]
MATFSITRFGDPIISVPVDTGSATLLREPIEESQLFGFEVEDREPETDYQLMIGDILSGSGPVGRKKLVLWDDAQHFESAQGRVEVRLMSRGPAHQDRWRERAAVSVYVNPTKLNDLRYHAMFDEIRRLASGLVFDLTSKSTRRLDLGPVQSGVSHRSSQMELLSLREVWRGVSDALGRIAADPVRGLASREELKLCWGGERISASGVSRLVAAGIDPRGRLATRPFQALCHTIRESTDIPEHNVISGVLGFLKERINECLHSIRVHVDAIEADRPMRDTRFDDQPSLYESNDIPKVERLLVAAKIAESLNAEISAAERLPFLRSRRRSMSFPNSPVFRYVEPYYRLRSAVEQYLFSSTVVLDDGADLRIKSTQRMYEQWVFIQLASAMRHCGLRCRSEAGLLGQHTRYRFTLDIDRGTTLSFEDRDGRIVNVRYEPYIYCEATARQRKDSSIFQGESHDVAWSPDLLVEFTLPGSEGAIVEHVIVMDAKYTRTIRDSHWNDTLKYLQLRSLHDGRQIARQLWLVHPSDAAQPITFRDTAVRWTADGPSRPMLENLAGMLAMLPPDRLTAEESEDGWVEAPVKTMASFAEGLIRYFGIRPFSTKLQKL